MDTKSFRIVQKASSIDDGWVTDKAGAQYTLVHVDKSHGMWVFKSKFEAGLSLPNHLHTGPVIGYTTRGCWGYPTEEVFFERGDYCFEPAGTYHEIEVP